VDLDKQRLIAEGTLWDHPSMQALRPPTVSSFDGCPVADIKTDTSQNLMYVALAREPRLDVDGKRHYVIASLRLPELSLASEADLEDNLETLPRLLLSEDREQVMVSYSSYEEKGGLPSWRNIINYFTPSRLRRVRREEALRLDVNGTRLPSSMPLSTSATWASGQRILDRTFILDSAGRVLEHIDPYAQLSHEARDRLQAALRIGEEGAPYLAIAYADNAAGRTLFVVGDDLVGGHGTSGLWVHDLSTGMSPRPILTSEIVAAYDPASPETPSVHLTPDGNSVLLEDFEWRPINDRSEGGSSRFKTGRLSLYSVSAGNLIRTIQLQPAPGFATRMVGFSPDGNFALIGTPELLYVVPIDQKQAPIALRSVHGFNPFWSVSAVFVDK
jgi:hypothetical protein